MLIGCSGGAGCTTRASPILSSKFQTRLAKSLDGLLLGNIVLSHHSVLARRSAEAPWRAQKLGLWRGLGHPVLERDLEKCEHTLKVGH